MRADFGEGPCLDVVVHSLANGPEVKKDLLATSRHGYLGAVSVSAYSMVSLVQRLGPLVRPGGAFLSLSYLAAERVIPGYGGGMSSAKAALESDTRVLAWEAGRKWGHRVNCISAVARARRAPSARRPCRRNAAFIDADDRLLQGQLAAPRGARAARGGKRRRVPRQPARERDHRHDPHVDKGYHAMGKALG